MSGGLGACHSKLFPSLMGLYVRWIPYGCFSCEDASQPCDCRKGSLEMQTWWMMCPVSEGNLWLRRCRPSPATSLTCFTSSGRRDVIASSAHPTQNVILLASPSPSRWPAWLTHFSSTVLILFQQLTGDGARNPKPIDLKFCSPHLPWRSRWQKRQPNILDSIAKCYLLPGGLAWRSKFQSLGIFHPNLG